MRVAFDGDAQVGDQCRDLAIEHRLERGFASFPVQVVSPPTLSRIELSTDTVGVTTAHEGIVPSRVVAGAGNLWVASRNPDAVVRIGPVP
jgi:hypothetical protein